MLILISWSRTCGPGAVVGSLCDRPKRQVFYGQKEYHYMLVEKGQLLAKNYKKFKKLSFSFLGMLLNTRKRKHLNSIFGMNSKNRICQKLSF